MLVNRVRHEPCLIAPLSWTGRHGQGLAILESYARFQASGPLCCASPSLNPSNQQFFRVRPS